mgnify:CR=1 FL=1
MMEEKRVKIQNIAGIVVVLLFMVSMFSLYFFDDFKRKYLQNEIELKYLQALADRDNDIAGTILTDGKMSFKIMFDNQTYELTLYPEDTEELKKLQEHYKAKTFRYEPKP